VTIPEEKKRPRHEVLAEFEKEKSGILNWAIGGLAELNLCGGLKAPKSVLTATEQYRTESDQFSQFLQQCTIQNAESKITLKTFVAAFKRWCEENGENPRYKSSQKICHYLRQVGYETKKIGHAKKSHVFGIELINEEEPSVLPEFGA
jgi:putative DNA primase/helicase